MAGRVNATFSNVGLDCFIHAYAAGAKPAICGPCGDDAKLTLFATHHFATHHAAGISLYQYNEKRRWAFLTAAEHFPNPLGAAYGKAEGGPWNTSLDWFFSFRR
jgi:hypothetical protein